MTAKVIAGVLDQNTISHWMVQYSITYNTGDRPLGPYCTLFFTTVPATVTGITIYN